MIDYEDNIGILCQWRGSVVGLGVLHAVFATGLAICCDILEDEFPSMQEYSDVTNSSILWSAMSSVIAILIAFRIKQALGRFWEGTSLLHQMRGEWFDAASCLITFSRDAKYNKGKAKEVDEFRSTLVRLMSLMHGSALDEISSSGDDLKASYFEVIDIQGLDSDTLLFLRDCQATCNFSKVEALQHLVQVLITQNHHKGVLTIPPPILSRVYQSLSRGFVNLLNARKIKVTRFPFPFAQTIKIFLVVHTLITPIMMTAIIEAKAWPAIFTFIFMFGIGCLNCIAEQLEMPFGMDSNDLPLNDFQMEFNLTLLMLVDARSDHMPASSGTALRELSVLALGKQCNEMNQLNPMNSMQCLDGGAATDSRSTMRRNSARNSMSMSTTSDLLAVVDTIRGDVRRPSIGSDSMIPQSIRSISLVNFCEPDVLELRTGDEASSVGSPQTGLEREQFGQRPGGSRSSSGLEISEQRPNQRAEESVALRQDLASQLEQLTDLVRISAALETCRSNTLERVEQQLADLCGRMEDDWNFRTPFVQSPRTIESRLGASSPRTPSPYGSQRPPLAKRGLDLPAMDLDAINQSLRQAQAVRIGTN